MSRRVFLHVGAPKTGTTYLQSRLAVNRELLEEQGLRYPTTGSGNHFEAAIDLIDHPWGGQLKAARGEWDALVAAALDAPGDAVISHEVLAAATPAQVARARASLAGTEVHLVVTARDLGRQIPAEWQETIKHRGKLSLNHFTRKIKQGPRTASTEWFWRVQGLPDVLGRWSADLPPDRVHLVTVAPPGAGRRLLWERFVAVLGLDPALELEPAERLNTTLGIVEIATLRHLNMALKGRSIPVPVYGHVVRDLIAGDSLAGREGQIRPRLNPADRDFVEEVTGEWIDWIEGSGIHVEGDVADLRPRWTEAEDWVNPDAVRASVVLPAAIEALAAMVELESRREREARKAPPPPPRGRIRGRLGL